MPKSLSVRHIELIDTLPFSIFVEYYSGYVKGLLTVYLVVLCVLSVCSVVATLLHFIAYPNNVTMFNFAVLGVALAAEHWLGGTVHWTHTHTHTHTH